LFIHVLVIIKKLFFLVVLPLELSRSFIQVVILVDSPVSFVLLLAHVLSGVLLQFFQLVRVGGTDELAVHVKNLALWVHEELTVVSFNLDSSHDHVVFQID